MRIKTSINYSPNFSTYRRIKKNIKYLILHYTGMDSESKAIKRLTDDKSKVSCHYFIRRNGSIILMVPDLYEAWHAGKSNWKKDKSLNKKSIGIEISNKGHQFGYQKFTNKQIKSFIKLSLSLIKKYKINKKNILGHSDIAFNRKKDPGEKFPWKYLSESNIGVWPDINDNILNKYRKARINRLEEFEFFKCLEKFGYKANIRKSSSKFLLVKSFQRHFRQKLINGIVDKECLIIAKKLSNFG